MLTSLNWSAQKGFTMQSTPCEVRDIHEALHVARPILLSQEPCSFDRVFSAIGTRFSGSLLRTRLKELRQLYEKGDVQPLMQMSVGDQPLFHDSALKLWLNGVQYHHDLEKRQQIQELEKALGAENVRAIFLTQLSGKFRAALILGQVVNLILASIKLDFGHSGINPLQTRQERAGAVRKLGEVWREGRHHEIS
jgi:hypothetical protein